MFTDIVGSTELLERLGDSPWLELLRGHNTLVREQVRLHHGREIKATGDGFMLAFSSARAGLRCAIAIQRELGERRRSDPRHAVHVRIGLHPGWAQTLDADLVGRDVVVAARIGALAAGDEILVSETLRALVGTSAVCRFGRAREHALKGLTGQHVVYAARWSSPAGVAVVPATAVRR
jgi:class 3 adenylate cyclase